jgi:hypothetical protein
MPVPNSRTILLSDLNQGVRNLTPVRGAAFCEAGAVCLASQGHQSGVGLQIAGIAEEEFTLLYPAVTEKMRQSWSDEREATDNGACGVAILLMRELTGLTVIERAVIGDGFDYWLGPNTEDDLRLEDLARLEVSGIRQGSEAEVKARVRQKLAQTAPSDHLGLPAYVVVVEFSRPLSRVVNKNEQRS